MKRIYKTTAGLKYFNISFYRNPAVKFSDVFPREDDDDKTWRGDDAWRTNVGKFINLKVKFFKVVKFYWFVYNSSLI